MDHEFECRFCPDFRAVDMPKMRYHIAVDHSEGRFSTIKCNQCDGMYYDVNHFLEHTENMTKCQPMLMHPMPLTENLQLAFNALVAQMSKSVEAAAPTPPTPNSLTASTPISLTSSTPFQFLSSCKEESAMDEDPKHGDQEVICIDLDDETDNDRKDDQLIGSMSPAVSVSPANSNAVSISNKKDKEKEKANTTKLKSPPQKSKSKSKPTPSLRSSPRCKTTPNWKRKTPEPTKLPEPIKKRGRAEAAVIDVATPEPAPTPSPAPASTPTPTPSVVSIAGSTPIPTSNNKRGRPKTTAQTPEIKEESFSGRSLRSCRIEKKVAYQEPASSDGEEEKEDDSDDDETYTTDEEEKEHKPKIMEPKVKQEGEKEKDKDEETECGDKSKKLLDLCQLCVDLQNNRAPIFVLAEKEAHALIHLKFADHFSSMTDAAAKKTPEFKKTMRMCFEEGFYEELKRQDEEQENEDDEEETGEDVDEGEGTSKQAENEGSEEEGDTESGEEDEEEEEDEGGEGQEQEQGDGEDEEMETEYS